MPQIVTSVATVPNSWYQAQTSGSLYAKVISMEHVLTSIVKAIALDSYHVSLQMKFLQQLAWKDISPWFSTVANRMAIVRPLLNDTGTLTELGHFGQ